MLYVLILTFYRQLYMIYKLSLFDPILNLKILRKKFHKWNSESSFYFWFSSFYGHWYMRYKFGPFLTQFWVKDVTTRVKTAIFWDNDLKNKLLTSKFHQKLILIFLSPSIMIYNFGPVLNNLEIITSQKN